CVRAVTGELSTIQGVSDVSIELDTGAVTIVSDTQLDTETVRAAIAEAGYELRGQSFSQACPRCGETFSGTDASEIVDMVVGHALDVHKHSLDREVVFAHLEDRRPGE
ncbi:MAG: heavy-metal-associated domain-containing protein, partial [Acidimicrobiales bacterium]